MTLQRPQSLADVADGAAAGGALHDMLRDFTLEFSRMDAGRRDAALTAEPLLVEGDDVANAYLAAVAEMLALREGLDRPGWIAGPKRFLKLPWYAAGLESLKATLLAESPAAFRIRNLFVSANVLDRPGYRLAMNEVGG
jgi:hypothetical protein